MAQWYVLIHVELLLVGMNPALISNFSFSGMGGGPNRTKEGGAQIEQSSFLKKCEKISILMYNMPNFESI